MGMFRGGARCWYTRDWGGELTAAAMAAVVKRKIGNRVACVVGKCGGVVFQRRRACVRQRGKSEARDDKTEESPFDE